MIFREKSKFRKMLLNDISMIQNVNRPIEEVHLHDVAQSDSQFTITDRINMVIGKVDLAGHLNIIDGRMYSDIKSILLKIKQAVDDYNHQVISDRLRDIIRIINNSAKIL